MIQDKPLRTSWERKMKERQEKKLVKNFAQQLENEKRREREVRRQMWCRVVIHGVVLGRVQLWVIMKSGNQSVSLLYQM